MGRARPCGARGSPPMTSDGHVTVSPSVWATLGPWEGPPLPGGRGVGYHPSMLRGSSTLRSVMAFTFGFLCFAAAPRPTRILVENNCDDAVTCTWNVASTGSFSASGTQENGTCVCHPPTGEVRTCLTQDCNVDVSVVPQWGQGGVVSGRRHDEDDCHDAASPGSWGCKVNSCGGSSLELKRDTYSGANCTTYVGIWKYRVNCSLSDCADRTCQ